MQGLTADPSLYDATPKTWSSLVDHAGTATSVAFTFLAPDALVGWAGTVTPPGTSGQDGLHTDYMIIYPETNDYSITTDGSYDFEITGLSASTNYRLGLVSSYSTGSLRGLDFIFNGSVTCEVRNAHVPTNYVTVQSDATGKIAGTVALPVDFTQGNWGGMTIDVTPPEASRMWNLDIGGDPSLIPAEQTLVFDQDTVAHPHGSDEFGLWNVMNVPALADPYPAPTVTNPSVVMADSTGDSTNPVTFQLIGEVGGWVGIADEDTGAAALREDYAIMPKVGAASGLPNSLDFELTGLQSGKQYCLTYIHPAKVDKRRHLSITTDLNGDNDLEDETAVIVSGMLSEKTVYFTANAAGKLIGSMYFPGDAGEGDPAGIRLALLSPSIPGDTNGDQIVDETDATVVAGNWGATVPGGPSVGDFNNDGVVDATDASIMAANWGDHTEGGGEGIVPEPSAAILLFGMLFALIARRGRR